MKIKRRLRYKRIFGLLAFAAVLILVGLLIYNISREKWVTLKSGYISITTQHKALIICDEIVYKALCSGEFKPAQAEGSRIKKGQVIGELVSDSDQSGLVSNDGKPQVNTDSENKLILNKEDLKKNVDELFIKLNEAIKNKDISSSLQIKRDLGLKLEKLQKSEAGSKSELSSVVNEKYAGSSTAKAEEVFSLVSSDSGVISFYIDEISGKMNYDKRYEINYEELFTSGINPTNVINKAVQRKEPIFKVVTSSSFYLMCELSADELEIFNVEDEISVQLNAKTLKGQVADKFISQDSGIVAIEIRETDDSLLRNRLVDVSLVQDKISAAIVPYECTTKQGDVLGVFVKGINGEKVFRPIDVKHQNEEGYVVSIKSYTYKDSAGNLITVDTVTDGDEVLKLEN